MSHESNPFGKMSMEYDDSPFHEAKYDEPRLPTFEETVTQERLEMERSRLMEATKGLSRLKLEMEATIRAEMEAKIRAEMCQMEEERKAQEEQRLLEQRKKGMRDKVIGTHLKMKPECDSQSKMVNVTLDFIRKNKILYYEYDGGEVFIEALCHKLGDGGDVFDI